MKLISQWQYVLGSVMLVVSLVCAAEREGARELEDFRPQTPREEALVRMIRELQKEVAQLRREIRNRDGDRRDGDRRDGDRRDGDRREGERREGDREGFREGDEGGGQDASGSFKGYDTGINTVTVSVRTGGEGGTRERVFTLESGAEVVVDGKKGAITQIGKDCSLRIWLRDGSRDRIRRLEARGQWLGGRRGINLRRMDVDKKVLTLRGRSSRDDKTYNVAKNAKVYVDGKPARLPALSLRRRVSLYVKADMKTVIAIKQGDPEQERRKLQQERRIFGNTDKNKDGTVTFEEYFVLSEGQDEESRARWHANFKRGDRDGDGAWSLSEFISARTGRRYEDRERE